jgi:hypothetical protein
MNLTNEQNRLYNRQLHEIDFWHKISGSNGWKYMFSKIFRVILLFFVIVWVADFIISLCFSNGQGGLKDFFPFLFTAFKLASPPVNSPWYHILFYLIMGAIALCLTPVLTTCVMRAIDSRTDAIRKGRKVYPNMYNHFVVIGYNRYALKILSQILNGNESYAIIMTTQDSIKLRETLENHLDRDISRRVIIYAGDAISQEKVASLNLNYARTLYLLHESDNTSPYTHNLSILKNIVNAASGRDKEDPLEVYMQINSSKAYNLLQRVDIPSEFFMNEGKVVVDFRPFNFHENWSRLLWSYYKLDKYDPLDFEPLENTNKHVHLVISGFNSMGRALLLEALRLCHYPNFDEKTKENKTVISIFDDQLKTTLDNFKAQYPNLDEIIDIQIDFHDSDINSPEARRLIEQWAKDEKELLTIAICDKDADVAMTYALNLPKVVFYQKELFKHETPYENYNRTRVLVRQEIEKSFDEMFAYKNGIAYPHIQLFGSLEEGLCLTQLDDNIAICINGIYSEKSANGDYMNILYTESLQDCIQKIHQVFDKEQNLDTWRGLWAKLSENMKWSNRFQADIYDMYIRLIERIQKLPRGEYDKISSMLPNIEHRRWCAERVTASWRQKEEDGYRVNELHIHKSIVPFSELPESEIIKDLNVIATAKLIADEADKLYKK